MELTDVLIACACGFVGMLVFIALPEWLAKGTSLED